MVFSRLFGSCFLAGAWCFNMSTPPFLDLENKIILRSAVLIIFSYFMSLNNYTLISYIETSQTLVTDECSLTALMKSY